MGDLTLAVKFPAPVSEKFPFQKPAVKLGLMPKKFTEPWICGPKSRLPLTESKSPAIKFSNRAPYWDANESPPENGA